MFQVDLLWFSLFISVSGCSLVVQVVLCWFSLTFSGSNCSFVVQDDL